MGVNYKILSTITSSYIAMYVATGYYSYTHIRTRDPIDYGYAIIICIYLPQAHWTHS